jgi:hypothetical protein
MSRFAFFCCAAMLVGCGKPKVQPAEDTTAASVTPATPERPAAMSLTDVAGKWKLRSTDEAGKNAVESDLAATADTSGWSLTRPGGKTVPVRVMVDGDSIILEPGRYESALRKGIPVQARIVLRLQAGKLVGTTEARYAMNHGDSVAKRPTEGTRAP